MFRTFAITAILASLAAPAFAAAEPTAQSNSGLVCFSIKPAKGSRANCDTLCTDKGAACTAMTQNGNPPLSCADKISDPDSTLCRCCAVER